MAFGAVHQDADAVGGEQQRREHEPRQLALLAGVGRPVEIGARPFGDSDRFLDRADKPLALARVLGPHPEHGKQGAELQRLDFAPEDHPGRFQALFGGQRARERGSARDGAHVLGEGVFFFGHDFSGGASASVSGRIGSTLTAKVTISNAIPTPPNPSAIS